MGEGLDRSFEWVSRGKLQGMGVGSGNSNRSPGKPGVKIHITDCRNRPRYIHRPPRNCSQLDNFNSRIASPAPLRLARRISEYFRDRRTPGAPARKAARTASFTLCGVDLLLCGSVGISMSMPGQNLRFGAGDAIQGALGFAVDVVGGKSGVGNLFVACLP